MTPEQMTKAKDKCRIQTPICRLSYPHLFKPSAMPGTTNKPTYSAVLLFEKDSDSIAPIREAIHYAKVAKFGAKENWPKNIKSPIKDGDDPEHAKKEGHRGCMFFTASSGEDRKPQVVDADKIDILNASEVYGGCYVKAVIYAMVWEFPLNSGKFGVSLKLNAIMKVRDGKPFGAGAKSSVDMFTPVGVGEDDGYDEGLADENGDEVTLDAGF